MRLIDLTGQRFGRLVVKQRTEKIDAHVRWTCICDCGKECSVRGGSLKAGLQQSCGCLRNENNDRVKHGHSRVGKITPGFTSWASARIRTDPENASRFPDYAGRGIRMCERWANDFQAFFDDMGPRPHGKTLERIDVNGNYEPSNCKWATKSEQVRNRRVTICTEWKGVLRPLAEIAEIEGVSYDALRCATRRRNVPIEEAVEKLKRKVEQS